MNAALPARLRLPRSRRLRLGRDFRRTREQGRRVVQGCLIANWIALPAGAASRLGVITTRRLGNAVARARARRLLRESFRRRQTDLSQPIDLVLIARSSIVGQRQPSVEADFVTALRRAGVLRPAGPSVARTP